MGDTGDTEFGLKTTDYVLVNGWQSTESQLFTKT